GGGRVELEMRSGRISEIEGGAPVSQRDSGIEGQALLSPSHPGPIRLGEPHPEGSPFETTLAVYAASDGKEVTRVKTGADGRFRISLPPGSYLIGGPRDSRRRLPRAQEESVEVKPGNFSRVTITFDSGMRSASRE